MPKKTFHLPEEHADLYDQAKEMADYFNKSISSVIVDGLKHYVDEGHAHLKDIEEFMLWEGSKLDNVEATGRFVKFSGKLIAKGGGEQGPGQYYWEVLYYTKKKKWLLFREKYDGVESITTINVADTIAEISKNGLLPELLEAMRVNRAVAEDLDV